MKPPASRRRISRLWVIGVALLVLVVLAAVLVVPDLIDPEIVPTVAPLNAAATLTAAAPVLP